MRASAHRKSAPTHPPVMRPSVRWETPRRRATWPLGLYCTLMLPSTRLAAYGWSGRRSNEGHAEQLLKVADWISLSRHARCRVRSAVFQWYNHIATLQGGSTRAQPPAPTRLGDGGHVGGPRLQRDPEHGAPLLRGPRHQLLALLTGGRGRMEEPNHWVYCGSRVTRTQSAPCHVALQPASPHSIQASKPQQPP